MAQNIWFVSDMHFGHKNIRTYCDRPFDSTEDMNEALVENWNEVVGTSDIVYHLGDWAFNDYHHIGRLKGNIFSVPGNHDLERKAKLLPYLPNGFTDDVVYLKVDRGTRLTLCHFPFEAWRREYPIHLHGHTHGMTQTKRNPNDRGYEGYTGNKPMRLDVGVDATRLYRPINLDEVVLELLKLPF